VAPAAGRGRGRTRRCIRPRPLHLLGRHEVRRGPRRLNCVVRVRHLTFVQMALKELHHDNGVRVEQPALPGGTGSGGEPADKEHQLLAVRWLRVEP